jgi:hypothetical protein
VGIVNDGPRGGRRRNWERWVGVWHGRGGGRESREEQPRRLGRRNVDRWTGGTSRGLPPAAQWQRPHHTAQRVGTERSAIGASTQAAQLPMTRFSAGFVGSLGPSRFPFQRDPRVRDARRKNNILHTTTRTNMSVQLWRSI